MVQGGDRCDFIGTLIVVPDVAQLQMEGMTIPYKYGTQGIHGAKNLCCCHGNLWTS